MLKRKLFYLLPSSWRPLARQIYYWPIDLWDRILGRRDSYTPPKGKIFVGSGDFKEEGHRTLEFLKLWAGMRPSHQVLEVGCGIGRKAVPLIGYLNPDSGGSYDGFDIVKKGIKWCQKNISRTHPHFTFIHADIANDLYNKQGHISGTEFMFPYSDGSFDLVFLTSVFTHMPDTEVAHYMAEISRVLRPGGKLFITWFIWNNETERLHKEGLTDKQFPWDKSHYRLMDKNIESANVAYNEEWILHLYHKFGFSIISPIHYGWWRGINKQNDYQDTIVAQKN